MESANEPKRLVSDVRLGAVAMAVGALDAYLCDKYADCLTCALQKYARGKWPGGSLPASYKNRELPIGIVLDQSRTQRPLWGVRMAVRAVMERDNMLSVSRLPDAFNGILPPSAKIWSALIPGLIDCGSTRFSGPRTNAEIAQLRGTRKTQATKEATKCVVERIGRTVQLRHDWIHNCGRPKEAINRITEGQARIRVWEVTVLVRALDDHIERHRLA